MSASGSLQTGTHPPTNGSASDRVALPRDLSDLLIELSLALGHQSAYPSGHPVLVTAAERLTHALGGVLARRETLTLGIARRQFVIDGVATDPANALLGNLAQRFHRHRIVAARFERGITQSEVTSLLAALGTDARRDPGPIGLRPEESRSWTHAELLPAHYSRLELSESPLDAEGETAARDVELWLELARAALPDGAETEQAGSGHPGVVAAAINRRFRETSYDETVVSYLLRVAEEVAVGETVEQAWLRRRLSRLIDSLEPAALERLLQVGGSEPYRRRFVLAASQTLAADAVVKVVEAAAADSSQRNISDSLMLLFGKLGHHAESDVSEVAAAAESALRENVGRLVANWELDDPNPEAYSSVLQHLARAAPANEGGHAFELDPEDILRIGLEIGESGPRVQTAAEQLVAEGRTRLLTDLLAAAPDTGAGAAIWLSVAKADLLVRELKAVPVDFKVVEALVAKLGADASAPLLDALAVADDRSTRWNLIRILGEIGAPAAPAVVARLPDKPWFVQRNLLLLLGRLGGWPDGFSPAPYASHGEARVRREAYRLLLDTPDTRAAAITAGLADPDAGILTMVLGAAMGSVPLEAVPFLARIVQDTSRDGEVRLLAVRALAASPDPDKVARLASLARRRRWWGGTRLTAKSPVLLTVLKALAESFAAHPEARDVIAMAERHRDPEIRAAVAAPVCR